MRIPGFETATGEQNPTCDAGEYSLTVVRISDPRGIGEPARPVRIFSYRIEDEGDFKGFLVSDFIDIPGEIIEGEYEDTGDWSSQLDSANRKRAVEKLKAISLSAGMDISGDEVDFDAFMGVTVRAYVTRKQDKQDKSLYRNNISEYKFEKYAAD